MPQPSLQPEILRYYETSQEGDRLETPGFSWEKLRTLDLLRRLLPPPPAEILDVGGGAGAYAFPLAEAGYAVDLIDPVPLHLDQARKRAAESSATPRSFRLADARALPAPAESADAVLLLGPLYHLPGAADRAAALREAFRVLRPRGILIAAAISRFASALDGIARGFIRDPEFAAIVERDLATGHHENPTGNPNYFTTAYFHHPNELRSEVAAAGFRDPALYAIEGPQWGCPVTPRLSELY